MVLITGGYCQGKTAFAKTLCRVQDAQALRIVDCGADTCCEEAFGEADLIQGLHQWIAKLLQENKDPYEWAQRLLLQKQNVIVTVDELGCGIVPMEAFDRKWREITGRVCCILAEQAEEVYRVTCGIGTKIKG